MDAFYTCPILAQRLCTLVSHRWPDPDVLFVEPSAGAGAFVRPLRDQKRKLRAMDIQPHCPGIRRGDFLMPHTLFAGRHAAIVVLGNPPFGKNASTAVRFFNHSARWADQIAFIVPRTFRKTSLQIRLDPFFHLEQDETVPDYSFLRQGAPHDVPCSFQMWTRQPHRRSTPETPAIAHLVQFTTPDNADFAMRRVGFHAGRIVTGDIGSLSETTHYFMRELQSGVRDTLDRIDWIDVTSRTVGVRSLSKREIACKLDEIGRA